MQFHQLRQQACKRLASQNGDLVGGDCFHNGSDVLEEVLHWHVLLRKSSRSSDKITYKVLDIVDKGMLVAKSDERLDAVHLCEELDLILNNSRSGSDDKLPNSLLKALGEIEERMYSSPARQPPSVKRSDYLIQQDSKNLEPSPMKRSSAVFQRPSIATSYGSQIEGLRPTTPPLQSYHSNDSVDRFSLSIESTLWGSETFSNREREHFALGYVAQNVWQARSEIERRKAASPFKRTKKDGLLAQHFPQRDIVSSTTCPI
jgi:hypothetical protein